MSEGTYDCTLKYTLQPIPGENGEIVSIAVTIEFGERPWGESPILTLQHVAVNVVTPAKEITLTASDSAGPLPIVANDTEMSGQQIRQWHAERMPSGEVTAAFRIDVPAAVAVLGVAPPLELRAQNGAISGGAAATLPRPSEGEYLVSLAWDLSRLPEGAVGVSSLGTNAHGIPANQLDRVFYAAGALQHYPREFAGNAQTGYSAVWQGTPHFDVEAMMGWGEQLHSHMQSFFEAPPADYRVFMRRNDVNPGGGIGMLDSFLMTFGDESFEISEADMRFTLSHEMFHTFQPRMTSEGDVGDSLAHSWFNEGLAVYYQRVLPYRYGMVTAEEFAEDVNVYVARYATNIFAKLPNSEVPGRFWSDTRVRTLPYDRGFAYFVGVAEALRESGAATLDDLVREMCVKRREGSAITPELWAGLMRRELGDQGVQMLEDHLAGDVPLPAAAAFGSEFQQIDRTLRRFELGFDPLVLTESPRIIRGLVPGSGAEEAGLRNGDEILQPIGQDRVQGDQEATITLEIRRDDEEFAITYLPRGETVQALLWEVASSSSRDIGTLKS